VAAPHYLCGMALPRPARPSVAYADLRDFLRQRPPHRWIAATLAVIIPLALLAAFFVDASMSARPRPDIHYINSWPADRSDEEIKASQQAAVERRQAMQDERRRQWQRVQKQTEGLGIGQPDTRAPVPAAPPPAGEARH